MPRQDNRSKGRGKGLTSNVDRGADFIAGIKAIDDIPLVDDPNNYLNKPNEDTSTTPEVQKIDITKMAADPNVQEHIIQHTLKNGVQFIELSKLVPYDNDTNFWSLIDKESEEYYHLKESIRVSHVIYPIVVWQTDASKDEYTILAGHNRKRVLEDLLEETGDDYYSDVMCLVHAPDELDKSSAEIIIHATNATGRKMTKSEELKSLYRMSELYKENGGRKLSRKKGVQKRDELAKQLDVTGRHTSRLLRIGQYPIDTLRMLDEKKITQLALESMLSLPEETRDYLINNHLGELKGNFLKSIPSGATVDIVKKIIEADIEEVVTTKTITVKVSQEAGPVLYDLIKEWMEKNHQALENLKMK